MAEKDLTFKLFGKDVSASAALQKVGKHAQAAARQIEASARSASAANQATTASTIGLGNALGNLYTAAANQARSMAVLGVSTASSMQQAEIGFTTLLGSAQEAGAYLESLKSFAATTPFELPGLVDASRLLLGVGVEANQVIPIMTSLGDAAGALAINQDAFGRIMVAVSQSISAGTIKLGDMNQLMTNGLPVWKLMSDATGKSVTELQALISKGQLLSADVLPKMFAQMNKDYGGSMAKQAQTLGGLWSTLKDTLSQGLAESIQPLIPMITEGLASAIEYTAQAASALGTAFRESEPTIRAWASAVGTGVRFVAEHGDALLDLVAAATTALAAYKAITAAQWALNVALDANPVGAVIIAIAALAGAFYYAWQRSEGFRVGVSKAMITVHAAVQQLVKVVAGAISGILNVAATVVGVFDKGMAASLHNAAARVQSVATAIDSSIQGIRDRLVNVIVATQYVEVKGLVGGKVANITRSGSNANTREDRGASAADMAAVTKKATTTGGPGAIRLPSVGGGAGAGGAGGSGGASAKSTARQAVVEDLAGIVAALKKSRAEAGKAFADLARDVSKAGLAAARRIVDNYAKIVLPLSSRYEAIVKQLAAAQDKLVKLRDDARKYASDVAVSIIQGSKLGSQESVGGILTSLKESIAYASQFAATLAKLRALGADATTIGQLVEAGPQQGLKLAAQLADTGKAGVAQVASLQKQLKSAASTVGVSSSQAMYGAGIAAAEGLVKGLASQQGALGKQMEKLGLVMVQAIKKALKIKSPSQVMADVGSYSGLGVIQGLRSQHAAIERESARMLGAIGSATARTAGAGAGRGPVEVHQYYFPNSVIGDAAHVQRTVRAAQRRTSAVGAAA